MSAAHLYLVAYDISCPKRWRHVVKHLKKAGRRAQLSVFLLRLRPAQMTRLRSRLERIVDVDTDRLMVTDLGPADSAGARIAAENMMTAPGELEALVV